MTFLKSYISETVSVRDKVTPHLTYRMVLCLVTLLISKHVMRVCQHQLSFLLGDLGICCVPKIIIIVYFSQLFKKMKGDIV